MALLELTDLHATYHKVEAVGVEHVYVDDGELVAMIGPNGVGKTTLLRAISRTVDTTGGLVFDGEDVAGLKPAQVIQRGIVHCPEGRLLFPEMTVADNLRMGAFLRDDPKAVAEDLEMVCEIFPVLADRRTQTAGTLSGGEQQMCAIGRSLMSGPRLLMLDEPSFGLAPIIVDRIEEVTRQLNKERGLTILLVEQNVTMALSLATRAYILEDGRVAREGSAQELRNDDGVRRAYLGVA